MMGFDDIPDDGRYVHGSKEAIEYNMHYRTQCCSMRDSTFLRWMADRLEYKYKESPNYDYMQRLRQIASEIERIEGR